MSQTRVKHMHSTKVLQEQFNSLEMCNKELVYKLLVDIYLDEDGSIKKELKFNITNTTIKIQNSKLLGNPDDKFETMLFLPKGEGRKGEGGLRTKGYFKFGYCREIRDR